MNEKIHKGDLVEVITGKDEDKGKRGEVIRVLSGESRVVVQGINIRTKHQKTTQNSRGRTINPGRLKIEGPTDISKGFQKEGRLKQSVFIWLECRPLR